MARIVGVREQRVQAFYDTDLITNGTQAAATDSRDIATSDKALFSSASPGNANRTNMKIAGQLGGDQTFLCFAVRHELQLYGGNANTDPDGNANPAGFTTTAEVFIAVLNNSTFTFMVDEKAMLEGPLAVTPAGGGPWGFVNDSQQPLLTNGEPQSRALYLLSLPIAVTKRQPIVVNERKFNISGATTVNLLNLINGYSGFKMLRAYIDGYNTRNVN